MTDSEQTAKQLIEYLKKNRYGRATFLPLTSIGNRNTFNQDKALKEPGVLGLANSLVETDGQYAVSYTHLDVYKRQLQGYGKHGLTRSHHKISRISIDQTGPPYM